MKMRRIANLLIFYLFIIFICFTYSPARQQADYPPQVNTQSNFNESMIPTIWGKLLLILPQEVPSGTFTKCDEIKRLQLDLCVLKERMYFLYARCIVPEILGLVMHAPGNFRFWIYKKGVPVLVDRSEFENHVGIKYHFKDNEKACRDEWEES